MLLGRVLTALSGEAVILHQQITQALLLLTVHQLGITQAIWPESSHQKDHPIRSLHVLPPHITGNEVATLLQPREYYFHSRHPKAQELRDILRGLLNPSK